MQFSRSSIIGAGITILLAGAVGMLWVQQFRITTKLMQVQADMCPIMQRQPGAENRCAIATTGLWAAVQAKAKNTVIQVFAQIAELDLLQPYRTPSQGQASGSGFF